jgi:hypothetical protein
MGNKYKTDTIVSVTEIEKLLIILNLAIRLIYLLYL